MSRPLGEIGPARGTARSGGALSGRPQPAPGPAGSDPAGDRLGRGWAFPVGPTTGGVLPIMNGAALVRQSIRLILATDPGERVRRPDFGCGLRRFLMAPNVPATHAAIAEAVTTAITRWEGRIVLTSVEVSAGTDPTIAVITIAYLHRRDGSAGRVQAGVSLGGG